MISLFLFFPFLLFRLKDFFFISFLFHQDFFTSFMLSIFPIIFFLVFRPSFGGSSWAEVKNHLLIFVRVFFFLFFCFLSFRFFYFVVFVECCVLFIIFLIFNFSKDLDKISSALFMFLINSLGSIPFLASCWTMPVSFQTSSLGLLESSFSCSFFDFFFFLVLLCSKLPVFLLHFWLTKAHVSASGAGSIILAGLMLKIGSMGILKWSFFFLLIFCSFELLLVSFSVLTRCILCIVINRFFDVKYLVACSSILHMALTLPFFLQNSYFRVVSSCLIMVGHGLVSRLIFFLIRILYENRGNRSLIANKRLETCSRLLSFFLFFFFLINLGFPPFVGFISELIFVPTLISCGLFRVFFYLSLLLISGKFFITIILNLFYFKNSAKSGRAGSHFLNSVSAICAWTYLFLIFVFLCFFSLIKKFHFVVMKIIKQLYSPRSFSLFSFAYLFFSCFFFPTIFFLELAFFTWATFSPEWELLEEVCHLIMNFWFFLW